MTSYVVITPARDEEAHIEKTILAMTRQTLLPVRWIIVDDGSLDKTGEIIDRYAAIYPWITPLHRTNRGSRQPGGGVIDTFYHGYGEINSSEWGFLVKLDADLSFAPNYFELCLAEFEKDPRLGIGGGGIYHAQDGKLRLEASPQFHVRGATKIYRRGCWDELGGLIRAPGWDTVDEVKANMLGWSTRSFPRVVVTHHRFTGAAEGAWKDSIKNGRANYIAGYHPVFMFLKVFRRLLTPPYVLSAAGLMIGFLRAYFERAPQVEADLVRYTRTQQVKRLLLKESIWR